MVLDLCDGVGREVRVLKMCVEIVRKKIRSIRDIVLEEISNVLKIPYIRT
jgi:hypothetical protein